MISAGTCLPTCKRCPSPFFDSRRNGELMSLFTNDVDTISDALNNSFALLIQSFIQVVGTLVLLFVLNWRLSLLVVVGYAVMFWYIRFSTNRSRFFYARQQQALGDLEGYVEEMAAGQKVVKVFNHEQTNLEGFQALTPACKRRNQRPGVFRHHDPRRCFHLLYQLCGHCRAGRADGYERPVQPGQPGQLSGVCAPVCFAHQPIHPAG